MNRRFLLPLLIMLAWTVAVRAEGILLDVPLPITGKTSHGVARALERSLREIRQSAENKKNVEDAPAPTIILQFTVGPDQEQYGRGSGFGTCYELASLLLEERFQGIRTVAYFPQSVRGHALLVALACNERIAAEETEIGDAGVDEATISETQRKAYHEVTARRRALPPAVVDKLLDAQTVLLQVETEKGMRLISPAEAVELRKTETFADEPETLVDAGQPGVFSADMARKLNLIQLIANDRVALARSLGFRPDDIKRAPASGETGHAVRINLIGLMNNDRVSTAIRSIQSVLEPNTGTFNPRLSGVPVDFLCIYIDSPGGNIEASLNLASYLTRNVDSSKVRTVAYIPAQARSDAAIVALACDEIVLAPGAVLGGDGARNFSADQIADARRTIREFLSRESLRSWSLPIAFVDRDIEVFKMTRQGRPALTDYFCEDELNQQLDAELWRKGDLVKPRGKLLEVTGGIGSQLLVDRSARDLSEFKFLYGLENDLLMVEPSWADQLVQALSSPGMSALILMIVFLAVMIESKTPGIGIGAFVGVLGMVLFFWLNYLGGTAGWLEVSLFLVGFGCVLLEIFVLPGVGIFGIGGALAIVASLVLASQTFIIPQNSYQYGQFRNSLMMLVVAGSGVFVLGTVLVNAIHKANKPKDTALVNEMEKLASYNHLLGQIGTTITPLVPAGKAILNDTPVDVVSDGDLIEKGVQVEVVEVTGYKVVVRGV